MLGLKKEKYKIFVNTYTYIKFSCKKEKSVAICDIMDKTHQHQSKYSNSDRERLLYDTIYMRKQNKGRKVRQRVQKFNYIRWISPENLIYSMVTTVNSTIHFKFAKRADLKHLAKKR